MLSLPIRMVFFDPLAQNETSRAFVQQTKRQRLEVRTKKPILFEKWVKPQRKHQKNTRRHRSRTFLEAQNVGKNEWRDDRCIGVDRELRTINRQLVPGDFFVGDSA